METTNTNGVIAAAAEKKAAPANKPKSPANIMRGLLDSKGVKELLQNSLKENAGAFSASILDLYQSDKYLQMCDPTAVFKECLKAVSLKLPINKQLGFAYVIPYKNVPQFQLGYKGLIQLAIRSGKFKYINADVVYEGEFQGADKLTGYVDLNGEKTSDKVVGYFAYIETTDGFKKALYWSREKVTEHAKKFSKSYSGANSVWKTDFDAMAIKTVLRNLLSKYAPMSVEMANGIQSEEAPAESLPQGVENEIDAEISENIPETPESAPVPPPADDEYPFKD
ncbi:MAG: recombinase RecT [Lachnospiraceae bacterium]|nr:recombinase RecT [Lachnospiraceae bacterium]